MCVCVCVWSHTFYSFTNIKGFLFFFENLVVCVACICVIYLSSFSFTFHLLQYSKDVQERLLPAQSSFKDEK